MSRLVTLNPRQVRQLELLEAGRPVTEIAKEIGRSKRTTEVQIQWMLWLLDAMDRSDLITVWRAHQEPGHPERVHLEV